MYSNRNKSVEQDKSSFQSNSSMLKAKESGRVFYPSKARHSRHNSHSDSLSKLQSRDESPLLESQDSTTDSTSHSSSNNDSDHKSESAKTQARKMSDVSPIQLKLEDEPVLLVKSLQLEVVSNDRGIQYDLDEADLIETFRRFGPVRNVSLNKLTCKATIVMECQDDFTKAQQYMNNYILPQLNAYLLVEKEMEPIANDKVFPISKNEPIFQQSEGLTGIQTTINKNYQAKEVSIQYSEKEVSLSEATPQVVLASEKPAE